MSRFVILHCQSTVCPKSGGSTLQLPNPPWIGGVRRRRRSRSHSEVDLDCLKPRPYQQQCPSNIVECHKFNDSFDKVEGCFDIVAGVDRALVLR